MFGVESLISVTKFTSVFAERSASSNSHAQEAGRRDGGSGDKIVRVVARKRASGETRKDFGASSEDRAREARWRQSLNEAINSIALCRCARELI